MLDSSCLLLRGRWPREVVVNDVLGIAVVAFQPPRHRPHPRIVHTRGQDAEMVQRRVGDDEGKIGDDRRIVDEADRDVVALLGRHLRDNDGSLGVLLFAEERRRCGVLARVGRFACEAPFAALGDAL